MPIVNHYTVHGYVESVCPGIRLRLATPLIVGRSLYSIDAYALAELNHISLSVSRKSCDKQPKTSFSSASHKITVARYTELYRPCTKICRQALDSPKFFSALIVGRSLYSIDAYALAELNHISLSVSWKSCDKQPKTSFSSASHKVTVVRYAEFYRACTKICRKALDSPKFFSPMFQKYHFAKVFNHQSFLPYGKLLTASAFRINYA